MINSNDKWVIVMEKWQQGQWHCAKHLHRLSHLILKQHKVNTIVTSILQIRKMRLKKLVNVTQLIKDRAGVD